MGVGRSLALLALVLSMAGGYGVLERLTDAWPALAVFVVGGFVAGVLMPSRWAFASGPVAGALSAAASPAFAGIGPAAIELPFGLAVVAGVLVGSCGVPSAVAGVLVVRYGARRRLSRQGSPG